MKAQISIEFMIMIGMAALSMLVFLGVGYSMFYEEISQKNEAAFIDLGNYVQRELMLAAEVNDGYSRTIVVPDTINGKDYQIYVMQRNLFINNSGSEIPFRIPEVSGSIGKGENTISKTGGSIVIT